MHRIQKELKLTGKQFNTLAEYGYCDMILQDEPIKQWQQRMKEGMMEEESFEKELGESIWEPGDKRILIEILNK